MSFCHTARELSSPIESDDLGVDIQEFLDIFRGIPDPRDPRGLRHEFVFILAAATVATMAGAKSFRELADHIADLPAALLKALGARWDWFRGRYNCPAASTITALFAEIDIEALEPRIGTWLLSRANRDRKGPLVLALDGKVLRGAWLDDHHYFTLFSAMIHTIGVTVGQLRVPTGTTEVTQVGSLIDMIPAAPGATLVTVDAAHTHTHTSTVLKKHHDIDFIMTVKSNQPTLLADLTSRFKPVVTREAEHVIEERAHGRNKRWSIWTLPAIGVSFPHLRQVACIRRDVWTLDGTHVGKEFVFVITSASTERAAAADINHHVRGHWGIEGKSHWVRDTVWREDHNQSWIGNTAQTLAALRNLAIGAIRLAGINEVKRTTERIARDRLRAIPLLVSA